MEVKAIAKSVRISPRKVRLVADAIRNMPVEDAYRVLEVTYKRAARPVSKTLKSAVANAVVNAKLDSKRLYISSITVNESQALKRFRPSTRGRIHPYKKRGSHITIILQEKAGLTSAAAKASVEEKAVEVKEAPAQEEKKGGVQQLAARLTGRKAKTEEAKKK